MNARPTALVTGITGQTAAYLAKILLRQQFSVIGATRDDSRPFPQSLNRLGMCQSEIRFVSLDPSDPRQVYSIVASVRPDVIFNLAGQTSVALSFIQPAQAIESISISCLNFLEAIRCLGLPTRYFNAGSSECFGNTSLLPANEQSAFHPTSPYSIAKITSIHLTAVARAAYGIYACSGILSNHESPLRSLRFVTQKIITGLLEIKAGNQSKIYLGNLDVIRDWGWAPEYAEAIFKIAMADEPSDYIVATGESHSLSEFVQYACDFLDLDYSRCVERSHDLARPLELIESRLDPSKIKKELGWAAETRFKTIIEKLISCQLY
jgi:GDPmannose 4,6-dehydratase